MIRPHCEVSASRFDAAASGGSLQLGSLNHRVIVAASCCGLSGWWSPCQIIGAKFGSVWWVAVADTVTDSVSDTVSVGQRDWVADEPHGVSAPGNRAPMLQPWWDDQCQASVRPVESPPPQSDRGPAGGVP